MKNATKLILREWVHVRGYLASKAPSGGKGPLLLWGIGRKEKY